MSFIFNKNKEIKIYVDKNEPTSLLLAVKSLKEDLEAMFGVVTLIDNQMKADILVASDDSFAYEEESFYCIMSSRIYITGKGDLGAIFAIYSFLENELNVPPFYKIEGLKLRKRDSLELIDKTVDTHPHTRWRGWFVNDEDLLTGFKNLGTRDIDYNFYTKVIHPDMMDIIAETALRYRMNLIIPSTLVDICSPYEEKLIEVCSSRGLYISQHHIEPMGVSKFGFANYVKANNLKEGFSFVSNEEALTKCWEYYASKWSKYPRVIWQLGLRGGTDRPVWVTESNIPESSEARGELISRAIKKQYDIINKVYPYEVITTSTLWMEGAELIKNGDLRLPEDTIVVLSDIGMSGLFGDDFFTIKRKEDRKYGIYYHAAYWHTGPHLAECVKPEKMKYSYDLTRDYRTDNYSMLNVANIKDLTFSLYLNSKLAFEDNVDLEETLLKYARLYTKDFDVELKEAIKEYYLCLGDVGEIEYDKFCHKYDFSYHRYENLPFPVVSINDGMIRSSIMNIPVEQKKVTMTKLMKDTLVNGMNGLADVYKKFKNIGKELCDGYIEGFNQHWTYESIYMQEMLAAGYSYYIAHEYYFANDYVEASKYFDEVNVHFNNILELRKKYFTNQYSTWFKEDGKIGVEFLKKIILEQKETLLK